MEDEKPALKTHDFFVFYYEDDDLAHRFVEYFVRRWETEFGLKGLYLHRDAVIGKTKFAALEDDINRSNITVVVFTEGFMKSPNGFPKYANAAAFAKLLNRISTTPCYIPIGVGLEEKDLPSNIRDVISVAIFPEFDWDQKVKLWRQLDNVLVENNLLTQVQINKLGSTYKRYVRPAEKLMSDKFLRDHIATKICHEYFGLGIGLAIPHTRLEQIKKTDSDPFNYIFKMLVTWREDCEQRKMSETDMLNALLEALHEVERLDVKEIVRDEAVEFMKKREQNQSIDAKRRADEEAALLREQQNCAAANNGQESATNNQSRGETNSTLKYVAQEENGNEQTSVMKIAQTVKTVPNMPSGAQGYVHLHGAAPVRYDGHLPRQESEQQVVLTAGRGDESLQHFGSLIPRKSVENGNENSGDFFPESVPSWTLPVAMGMTAAVAVAVTAFVCMRYKS